MGNRMWVVGGLLVTGFVGDRSAQAADPPAEVLDVTILKAGAIIAAEVAEVVAVPGSDLIEVRLRDAIPAASRFSEVPAAFRTKGTLSASDDGGRASVHVLRHGVLTEGRRYILFITSGAWNASPLGPGPEALFEVDAETGAVRCGSGHVVGLDPDGVVCERVEPGGTSVMSEVEFTTALTAEAKAATRRRPRFAEELGARAHVLDLVPSR